MCVLMDDICLRVMIPQTFLLCKHALSSTDDTSKTGIEWNLHLLHLNSWSNKPRNLFQKLRNNFQKFNYLIWKEQTALREIVQCNLHWNRHIASLKESETASVCDLKWISIVFARKLKCRYDLLLELWMHATNSQNN